MSPKVWIDGKITDPRDAKVCVYDHGFLYGDGIFEGIRVYGGKIFECKAHMDRLFESARAIRLVIPLTPEQVCKAMEDTVKAADCRDGYIRLIVSRGNGPLGISPAKCEKPSVICIVDTITMYPAEMYESGMAVITSSVIRNHANALSPRIKSLNYLNNVLAKIEANDAGVPEAIMLNSAGNVAECTADNIFIVRTVGTMPEVQTPATSDGILEGVTRRVVMDICKSVGLSMVEKTLQRHDLYIADECFLTGTAAEVIPVTKIDGRPVGTGKPGPITRELISAFKKKIREEGDGR
ncbi:branched-chain-amino-acid transaminase [Humisphaera borealis]|uniref:Branched-chain-amino-acid aminotransferase n=1 Tax=Humisphaera borealis TaxID=2807512 RepID=A0A7M2WVF7_9BACT|nr:branched-chain-amino-acid transaminase [Humisphaera borealis]QOV89518.1 branched-chain-amino-acid transaminase [Humisphaera borealis]